jgi:hypothetical protein
MSITEQKDVGIALYTNSFNYPGNQGSGSGSGLDPDSVTLRIRIPDLGGKKIKKIQCKKCTFKLFFYILPLKRNKIALTTF